MNEEELKDVIFGKPIETREGNYNDGFVMGIYRAKNIIDTKQKEINRLNNIINELEECIRQDNIKANGYITEVLKSGLCQGDYPIYYYYAEKKKEITDKYLDKLKELKEENK